MELFEALESRVLLSFVGIDTNGQVRVLGNATADSLTTGLAGLFNGKFRVTLNGVSSDFDTGKVHSLFVDLGTGDDSAAIGAFFVSGTVGNGFGIPVTVLGGDGNDHIAVSGSSVDSNDGPGNDVVDATGSNPVTFRSSPGNDTLTGGFANDRFETGAVPDGADRLIGAGGTDTVEYFTRLTAVRIAENGAADDGQAGEGDNVADDIEILGGTNANDILVGSSGSNQLLGRGGDDILDGGLGRDTMDGGAGIDLVQYSTPRNTGVTAIINGQPLSGQAGENDTILPSVENLRGTNLNDVLTGSAGANRLESGGGQDTMSGSAGNDVLIAAGRAVLHGDDGNDSLVGGAFDDFMTGDAGNDTMQGGGGRDSIRGGAGNDSIDAGDGDDSVDGGDGNDILFGGAGNDQLIGGAGRDSLHGGDGNDGLIGDADANTVPPLFAGGAAESDLLEGDAGIDFIRDRLGNNTLRGGAGNDGLEGGFENDTLEGGDGIDRLDGLLGADSIDGGLGLDTVAYFDGFSEQSRGPQNLFRSSGVNVTLDGIANDGAPAQGASPGESDQVVNVENILGTSFSDTLTGNAGDNAIDGFIGDDLIQGLGGDDRLTGGGGNDAVLGGDGNDAIFGVGGNDSLEGDRGSDSIFGGGGNDSLFGNDDNDSLVGEQGDDRLDGGNGTDILSGGDGQDVAIDPQNGGDFVDLGPQPNGIGQGVIFNGTDGDDVIVVSRNITPKGPEVVFTTNHGVFRSVLLNCQTIFVFAKGGKDVVTMDESAGQAWHAYFDGGAGDDVLIGSSNGDRLLGQGGNDTLVGGLGVDTIDGGPGDDQIIDS
jgi:Ca2+-binding RTX toxin-like protein